MRGAVSSTAVCTTLARQVDRERRRCLEGQLTRLACRRCMAEAAPSGSAVQRVRMKRPRATARSNALRSSQGARAASMSTILRENEMRRRGLGATKGAGKLGAVRGRALLGARRSTRLSRRCAVLSPHCADVTNVKALEEEAVRGGGSAARSYSSLTRPCPAAQARRLLASARRPPLRHPALARQTVAKLAQPRPRLAGEHGRCATRARCLRSPSRPAFSRRPPAARVVRGNQLSRTSASRERSRHGRPGTPPAPPPLRSASFPPSSLHQAA